MFCRQGKGVYKGSGGFSVHRYPGHAMLELSRFLTFNI